MSAITAQTSTSPALDLFIERLPKKPYCTDDLRAGVFPRTRARAIKEPYIQANGPTHRYWLILDVDQSDAAVRWMDVDAPPPNLIVTNPKNGHAHYLYALVTPVRTAPDGSLRALRYAASVERGLREKLSADAGYTGLITKNPVHDDWRCASATSHVYELSELAEYVDLSTPPRAANDEDYAGLGRNCDLFERLRKWSYRAIRQGWPNADRWSEACLIRAQMLNDYDQKLAYSEVRAIAKSVAEWTYARMSASAFSAWQAEKGRKGGKKSKGGGRPASDGSERQAKPWSALGISRATYYRQKNKK